MAVQVVVGMQFGDEGKGKLVDYLAAEADLVVRYQGGDNAGHTVINQYGVFQLHVIPCGVFHPGCKCLVGTGMMVNPDSLLSEMEALEAAGLDLSGLSLSSRAQLILPHHVLLDECMERDRGIGTTRRGVGPAYAAKFLRRNLRAGDLADPVSLREKLEPILETAGHQLAPYGERPLSLEQMLERCRRWGEKLAPLLCDGQELLHSALAQGKHVLFEGQLGVMKDVDLGMYPYVTSSHPVAAYAAVSGGFPAGLISRVTGVAKAFSSAVGDGPFPTEMTEAESAGFRGTGKRPDDEFGARTGRPRRIGWLDLPILRYAHRVNGFQEMALTKLDKLDGVGTLKLCVGYRLDGALLEQMPDTRDLWRVEPVYETMAGWMESTACCKRFQDLPANARAYLDRISTDLGVPIRYVGNGPERDQVLVCD